MEIRAIKTFTTIIKLGSFQKAAEALNYSQPTITLHIKNLEEELGEKLLVRGKALKLTEVGRIFFERANAVLKEYERLEKTMVDLGDGGAGFIRLGLSEQMASKEFPSILSEFMNHYPNIQIVIEVANSNALSEMLDQGEIDFAVCSEPEMPFDHFFKSLYTDKIVLLVPEKHRLAANPTVYLSELENETILYTLENNPIMMKVEQHLMEAIGTNYKKLTINNCMTHKYYVKAGLGISLLTRTAHSNPILGTKILEIEDIKTEPAIGLLYKEEYVYFGEATNHLLSLIIDHFENKPKTESLQLQI